MRTVCSLSILLCLFPLALSAQSVQAPLSKRIVAVSAFDVRGNLGIPDAGAVVSEWMAVSLGKTGRYTLAERSQLAKVLEEQQLQLSDLATQSVAMQVGGITGADFILSGTIMEWKGIISVAARMISAQTGLVLSQAELKVRNANEIPARLDQMAQVLAGILPAEVLERGEPAELRESGPASVIKIIDRGGSSIVVLNRGSLDSVARDCHFLIYLPEYGTSEITGQKTKLGMRFVGTVRIDYVESTMSSGAIELDAGAGTALERLGREGLAVAFNGVYTGASIGLLNGGISGAMVMGGLHWFTVMELGYGILDTPLSPPGPYMDLDICCDLIGTRFSNFSAGIGLGPVAFMGNFLSDSEPQSFVLGGVATAEVEYLGWYLRGGAIYGRNIYSGGTDDSYTVYDHDTTKLIPFVGIGYRYTVSRAQIRGN